MLQIYANRHPKGELQKLTLVEQKNAETYHVNLLLSMIFITSAAAGDGVRMPQWKATKRLHYQGAARVL